MNRRTQLIIGITVVLLGVGFVSLGLLEDEQRVRQVADIVADPQSHSRGEYTLIGIPQPKELITGPNEAYQNQTLRVEAWRQGDIVFHTSHILEATQDGALIQWAYTNHTQEAGKPDTATQSQHNWTTEGILFLIQGFPDQNGETPLVWGVYNGVLRDAVQPKPSQFEGRITQSIDGQPLPEGPIVYQITEFTAGCSSKFLPDDHESTE